MSEDKYWLTTVVVKMLSKGENPPSEYLSLAQVHGEITDGDSSGEVSIESREITREEAREGLVAQGSDENFLDGDEPEEDEAP